MFDTTLLSHLVSDMGVDRVLLGTDHPFELGDTDPVATVRSLGLSDDDTEAILWRTADSLLGLSPCRLSPRSVQPSIGGDGDGRVCSAPAAVRTDELYTRSSDRTVDQPGDGHSPSWDGVDRYGQARGRSDGAAAGANDLLNGIARAGTRDAHRRVGIYAIVVRSQHGAILQRKSTRGG